MPSQEDVISGIKHPAIAAARRNLGQAGRKQATCFLADGTGLATQAMVARAPIETLFFLHPLGSSVEAALLQGARQRGIQCHLVSKGVFFKLLGLGYETSARVLAVIRRAAAGNASGLIGTDGCLLVGERIQDPRNAGVLIRTADAFGCVGAVFSGDSADPFSRAAVRSSTGSIFRVPITLAAELEQFLIHLKNKAVRLVGTSAQAETPCWQADFSGPCAVVLGNETVGLSEALRALCDQLVTVPMCGGAHSLNVTVAAGALLYERSRQRVPNS